ncbi:hypothetical protein D3C85_1801160 [compost metagenome]
MVFLVLSGSSDTRAMVKIVDSTISALLRYGESNALRKWVFDSLLISSVQKKGF